MPSFIIGLVAAVVIGSAVAISLVLGRRRSADASQREERHVIREAADPSALEREAERAAAAGDFERAVRLRFRAGVVRLARGGALPDRVSLTTGQLRRQVPAPSFRAIATAFDEIAYGGRDAVAADDDDARTGWRHVLQEVGVR
jgi:hypothetical protein